jgi:hypothetical protein
MSGSVRSALVLSSLNTEFALSVANVYFVRTCYFSVRLKNATNLFRPAPNILARPVWAHHKREISGQSSIYT